MSNEQEFELDQQNYLQQLRTNTTTGDAESFLNAAINISYGMRITEPNPRTINELREIRKLASATSELSEGTEFLESSIEESIGVLTNKLISDETPIDLENVSLTTSLVKEIRSLQEEKKAIWENAEYDESVHMATDEKKLNEMEEKRLEEIENLDIQKREELFDAYYNNQQTT